MNKHNSRTAPLLGCTLLACAIPLAGCKSFGSRARQERDDELNMTLFKELIQEGTLQPTAGFDEDDYYAQLAREYADAPREGEEPALDEPLDEDYDLGQSPDELPVSPYQRFGPRIVHYKTTGLIMKPYSFPIGTGQKIFDLMNTYGDFPVHATLTDGEPKPEQPQPLDSVVLDLREKFDVEAWSDPRGGETGALVESTPIALADVVIVTAPPDLLEDVEYFINLFTGERRQIEIAAKIIEVTTSDSLDLGVVPIDDTTPIFAFPNPNGFVKTLDFTFPTMADATQALLTIGAVFDGVQYNAMLQAVAAYESVSIISRPKVAVRDGARAEIVNLTKIPFFNVQQINAAGGFTTTIDYQEVGVQMYIIPHVIGEDTIGLNIDIEVSQQTGTGLILVQDVEPMGGGTTNIVTIPEISLRSAKTIVRLEPGQAVILGGLISERTFERETKVPLLGDIPILGYLFKSHFNETVRSNVLFFIRPRLLEGSDLRLPIDERSSRR